MEVEEEDIERERWAHRQQVHVCVLSQKAVLSVFQKIMKKDFFNYKNKFSVLKVTFSRITIAELFKFLLMGFDSLLILFGFISFFHF